MLFWMVGIGNNKIKPSSHILIMWVPYRVTILVASWMHCIVNNVLFCMESFETIQGSQQADQKLLIKSSLLFGDSSYSLFGI